AGRLDAELLDRVDGLAARGPPVDHARLRSGPVRSEDEVLGDAGAGEYAVPLPVLGDVDHAAAELGGGGAADELSSVDGERACGRSGSRQGLGELALSVPSDPGDAEDLTGSQGERHVVDERPASLAGYGETADGDPGRG